MNDNNTTDDRTAEDNPRMESEGKTIDPSAHDNRTFRPFVPDRMTKRRHDGHAPNQVLHDVLAAAVDNDRYLVNVDLLGSHDHSQREREGAIRYHVRATLENTGMGTPLLGASIVGDLVRRNDVAVTDAEAMDADTLEVCLRPIETTVEPVEIEYGDLPDDVKTHAQICNAIDNAFDGEIPDDVARGVEIMKAELTDGEFGESPDTDDMVDRDWRAAKLRLDGDDYDTHIVDFEGISISVPKAACGRKNAWEEVDTENLPTKRSSWCEDCLGVIEDNGYGHLTLLGARDEVDADVETDGGFNFDFAIHEP